VLSATNRRDTEDFVVARLAWPARSPSGSRTERAYLRVAKAEIGAEHSYRRGSGATVRPAVASDQRRRCSAVCVYDVKQLDLVVQRQPRPLCRAIPDCRQKSDRVEFDRNIGSSVSLPRAGCKFPANRENNREFVSQ